MKFEIQCRDPFHYERPCFFYTYVCCSGVDCRLFAGRSSALSYWQYCLSLVIYSTHTGRLRGKARTSEHSEEMYLLKIFRKAGLIASENPPLFLIAAQVIGSLIIMIAGAHTFVASLEHVSVRFGMNPLLFALLLAPVATELPEKFNSVSWTW